ncbi:hypothetical protein [Streptomyces sp. NPDC059452]|uniref:hypothetical protein n=1 Tax=Streptomyces sp. NPDC059452 TaxID=3346835 RepID=UPI003686D190
MTTMQHDTDADTSPPSPADQLATIAAAPDLTRPASAAERAAGLATLGGLYAGLVTAMESGLTRTTGICVFAVGVAVFIAWNNHHAGAARRRPHTRLESAARFGGPALMGIPGINLVFGDGPDTLTAHLVAAAVPTLVGAVYLVLRWRR